MSAEQDAPRIVSVTREIAASPERIFALIADPAAQPRWDGNGNLAEASPGQRVRAVGGVFTMLITQGSVRENHVVEFEEARRIAWRPSEVGCPQPGHLWRWELAPLGGSRTRVTHTYDWTLLTDEKRVRRARVTTAERLQASLDRLAAIAESADDQFPVLRGDLAQERGHRRAGRQTLIGRGPSGSGGRRGRGCRRRPSTIRGAGGS